MLTDLWPVLAVALAAVAVPLFLLRAIRGRTRYCGHSPDQCFWCGRGCRFYRLDEVD